MKTTLIILLALGILAVAFPEFWLPQRSQCAGCGPRNAASALKTLATAEADFRANDRDGNGKEDFWRADVAGLYAMVPKGRTSADPLKLIESSVAEADDRPATPMGPSFSKASNSGYWYRAIRKKGEPPLDAPSQFAFCAFPADYPKTGRHTFIIDEGNTIFKADLGHGRGIEVFPDDAELAARWSKLD